MIRFVKMQSKKIKKMKIAEIKSRGYNYSFDKFELVALVKCSNGSYIYHRCLFNTADEMYNIKVGDIVE